MTVRIPTTRLPTPRIPTPGKRHPVRRAISGAFARVHAFVDRTPPGAWIRGWLHRAIEYTDTEVSLRRGHRHLDGLTVVFLSDLHAGHFLGVHEVERVAARVAALAPDLVLLGGDLINTSLDELRHCAPLWQRLSPPLGLFAAPGNHDYFRRGFREQWPRLLQERGVSLLCNRGVRVRRGDATLWLCGVDDVTEGEPDLAAALDGRSDGEPTLLVSHHPDMFAVAADHGVDLQLSGHTHGGQIRVGRFASLNSAHGWLRGLHERNGAQLYVGRGLGVTVVPLRIGARPEVARLRLRVRGE